MRLEMELLVDVAAPEYMITMLWAGVGWVQVGHNCRRVSGMGAQPLI